MFDDLGILVWVLMLCAAGVGFAAVRLLLARRLKSRREPPP